MNQPPEYENSPFVKEPMSCHCGCDCPQECEIHRELLELAEPEAD